MINFIDEYFVKPMQYPDMYAPYNIFNTSIYAAIALLAAYLIYKYLAAKKIPVNPQFFNALLPYIFLGAIMRVIQDANILPRSLDILGFTIYPFITPGIYVLMFALLAVIYKVSKESAKGDSALMLRKVRDSGIGIAAVMLAILALNGISRVAISHILQLAGILLLAGLGLLAFELIKSRIYNKRETPEFKNLERTTVLSQALDGAATFIGVAFGGYSEQHVVANTLFGFFGSPFAFYLVKLVFALAIVFALRREAESPSEHVYVLALITIFGLAPGTRDALRLFFSV